MPILREQRVHTWRAGETHVVLVLPREPCVIVSKLLASKLGSHTPHRNASETLQNAEEWLRLTVKRSKCLNTARIRRFLTYSSDDVVVLGFFIFS